MTDNIRSVRDLQAYETAMSAAMEIFDHTKAVPDDEQCAVVDQMRRSS